METVNGQPALASIKFLTGSLAGSIYQITKPTTTLGREPANDIVLSDPSVSRHHAQITPTQGDEQAEEGNGHANDAGYEPVTDDHGTHCANQAAFRL